MWKDLNTDFTKEDIQMTNKHSEKVFDIKNQRNLH